MKKTKLYVALLLCSVLMFSCGGGDDGMEDMMSSCSDGLQNGEETGVDCGGDCDPCVSGPPSNGFYWYGIIDGEEEEVTALNGIGGGSCTSEFLHIGYSSWLIDVIEDIEGASINIIKLFEELPAEFSEYYPMYEEGVRPYGNCETGEVGVEIAWRDASGELWQSRLGDQTGSSFEILTRADYDGSLKTEITGIFSCKLYLEGTSEVKEVVEGSFSAQMPLH